MPLNQTKPNQIPDPLRLEMVASVWISSMGEIFLKIIL